jgi:hypothetical protein
MGYYSPRGDKATFAQIFRDHWEIFQQRSPRYQRAEAHDVVAKMLGCGDPYQITGG